MKVKSLFILFICTLVCISCATVGQTDCFEICVSSSASVSVSPDMVSFSLQATQLCETTSEAQGLVNEKISKVLAILSEYSVSDEDISTSSVMMTTEYEWDSRTDRSVVAGQRVSQTLSVKLHDLDSFGPLCDALARDVGEIRLYGVSFDCSDKAQAYNDARILAYRDALSKAKAFAGEAGKGDVSVISITDGTYYETSYRTNVDAMLYSKAEAAAVAADASIPVGDLSVRADVTVRFSAR